MYTLGIKFHIKYLCECIALASPELYIANVIWFSSHMTYLQTPMGDYKRGFELAAAAMGEYLPQADREIVAEYIERGIAQLSMKPAEVRSFIGSDSPSDRVASRYLEMLLRGDKQGAEDLIDEWWRTEPDVSSIFIDVFQKTQYEVGRLWEIGKIDIGQEHYCTAATQMIMSHLYPQLWANRRERSRHPRAVVACVEGELHEFGARMVADMFELDGWDLIYLGANTPAENIVKIVEDKRPEIILLSATIIYQLRVIVDIIDRINDMGRPGGIRIMVGGYPFNQDVNLWSKIGADGYAPDAKATLAIANQWSEGTSKC
ncbi:MAG: cobalamin-dependent protein [Methanomassiliicoccales archaeon]